MLERVPTRIELKVVILLYVPKHRQGTTERVLKVDLQTLSYKRCIISSSSKGQICPNKRIEKKKFDEIMSLEPN